MKKATIIVWLLLAGLTAWAEEAGSATFAVPVRQVQVERLPDLNIARTAHIPALVNGELTVIGGHTTGFLPTPTAEYYRDGAWHLLNTFFPHDFGFGVVLPSGEVMVGGGCADAFGEGQTPGVELYDPVSHSFSPLPIMDQRRARPSAALLSDGTVVISGNWFFPDYTSTYSVSGGPATVRRSVWQRAGPLIFQSSTDNALIFSYTDSQGEPLPALVERLRGEPFEVPLLEEWDDWCRSDGQLMSQYFIGDETVGGYAWLFPAIRKTDGQLGLIKVVGEDFSVLDTDSLIPSVGPEGETLRRDDVHMLADREQKCVWVIRTAVEMGRLYLFKVAYGEALRGGKAPVTIFRADLPGGLLAPMDTAPLLLPDGRIALLGGRMGDNYHPSAAVFILHTELMPAKRTVAGWWVALPAILVVAAILVYVYRRRKQSELSPAAGAQTEIGQRIAQMSEMMARIQRLMEERELFKKTDLKVEDVAEELGTNTTYVRQCIASSCGGSFKNYVNESRIRYVQQQLKEHPDAKITALALDAGFSSTASFYRNFTAVTGLSPAVWLKQNS